MVRVLWEDANSKLRNDKGETALHLAATAGSKEVVEYIEGFGVDAEARDISGRTPLHHAVRNNHRVVVGLLVFSFKAEKEASDYLQN